MTEYVFSVIMKYYILLHGMCKRLHAAAMKLDSLLCEMQATHPKFHHSSTSTFHFFVTSRRVL